MQNSNDISRSDNNISSCLHLKINGSGLNIHNNNNNNKHHNQPVETPALWGIPQKWIFAWSMYVTNRKQTCTFDHRPFCWAKRMPNHGHFDSPKARVVHTKLTPSLSDRSFLSGFPKRIEPCVRSMVGIGASSSGCHARGWPETFWGVGILGVKGEEYITYVSLT